MLFAEAGGVREVSHMEFFSKATYRTINTNICRERKRYPVENPSVRIRRESAIDFMVKFRTNPDSTC